MLKNLLFAGLLLSAFFLTANAQVAEDKDQKAELVNVMLTEHSYVAAQIVDKLFTFNISPSLWKELNNQTRKGADNDIGHNALNYLIEDAVKYAKIEGIGDLDALRVYDKTKEKPNRPMVDEIIKKMKSKFSIVVNAPMENKGTAYEMLLRYPYEIMNRLGSESLEWGPASGEAHFIVNLTTDAKDMSIKTSDAGKTYTVTGPAYTEAYDTQSKIEKGLNLTNKNN